MVMNLYTLTTAAALQNIQNNGLDALGLTTLALSPNWSTQAATYSKDELTLSLSGPHAPFRGILQYAYRQCSSELSAKLSESATSMTLADGSSFPTPPNDMSILLRVKSSGSPNFEVVECTGRSGNTLTIARAAQGTAKQSFDVGAKVTLIVPRAAHAERYYNVNGTPLSQHCGVFRLHPQAVLRLETLINTRYSVAPNVSPLPAPHVMVLRNTEGFESPRWYEPDEPLASGNNAIGSATISFHDARGLIVDPIYVAGLFADLQAWLPSLTGKGTSPQGSGSVQQISKLANGTIVHCVDLHGAVFQPAPNGPTLNPSPPGQNGILENLDNPSTKIDATDTTRLRWGWATNGVLGASKLSLPSLPSGNAAPNLPRPFYRLAVVDTVWSLLGDRTPPPGIPQEVAPSSDADALPQVRDQVTINYLADAPDTLGQCATVLGRNWQGGIVLLASPNIDATLALPPQAGPQAHWPAFPPPAGAQTGFSFPIASPATGITAQWCSSTDIVVTVAANVAPDGAHVRIYPQTFVKIEAISSEPSFVRGDGAAALAAAGKPTTVLLLNPFNLAPNQAQPSPANLTLDIVIAPRIGNRKLWAAVPVSVTGQTQVPSDPFAAGTVLGPQGGQTFQSVAPAPLFGIPATVVPPAAAPTNPVALIRSLANEKPPRQGPRLPTMARFETIAVTGVTGGLPSGTLLWEAVLSGARLARESRSALHASGNPGNPAGPDVHAAGIHVTGALAYDLALHAVRRAQPLYPVPSLGVQGDPPPTWSWLLTMSGKNFDLPTDNANLTGIGAVLETVAAVCETPELSPFDVPSASLTMNGVLQQFATNLGLPSPPTVSTPSEPRLRSALRREYIASKYGLRDTLYSLRRAVREARELIYVESPQFASTTYNQNGVDLVNEIATSLAAHPNLKVIICIPRESDFAPKYKGWSRQHFKARRDAIATLVNVAPDRVRAFHPIGFPGRTTYIRSTTVVVDDVWCLVGAAHWRRRGMTLDGSAAIASFDRQMARGYSKNVRAFRRALMAAKLNTPAPTGSATSPDWIRLACPESTYELISDWLAEGGLGKILPLWPGPSAEDGLAQTDATADPDGSYGADLSMFAGLIAELG